MAAPRDWKTIAAARAMRLAALALALSVVACGDGENEPPTTPASDAPPTTSAVVTEVPQEDADTVGDSRAGENSARLSDKELAKQVSSADPRMRQRESLVVPPADFAAAGTDIEPNNSLEEAQALGEELTVHGTLENRDKDFYAFDIDGEPQLWYIEAEGENLTRLYLYGNAGQVFEGRHPTGDSKKIVIANHLLMAGRHRVSVSGGGETANYTLRMVALGPPDPHAEREPNGDASRAHQLKFGVSRTGYLAGVRDVDYYRFSVAGEEQVIAQVAPPPGVQTRLAVWLRSSSDEVRIGRREGADETLAYRMSLLPGDYLLSVQTLVGTSNEAYTIRLDRMDPFDRPADLEPNDTFGLARPMPADLIVDGEVATTDTDWHRLPVFEADTAFVITPDARTLEPGNISKRLRLFDGERSRLRTMKWNNEAGVFEGTLPAGQAAVIQIRLAGVYHLTFAFEDGRDARPRQTLPVSIALPEPAGTVAAYWHEGQQVTVPVALENRGGAEATIRLDAVSSHHAWSAQMGQTEVTLAAGDKTTVPLTVRVAPDAYAGQPVHVTARAMDEASAAGTATLTLNAVCGAPPVGTLQMWPLPDALLGGFNVVATMLGAPPGEAKRQAELQDGFTPNAKPWAATPPVSLTFDLVGEDPVRVAGVVLNAKTSPTPDLRVKDFDVAVSLDGQSWSPVLSAQLGRQPVEQAFVFVTPAQARFVQLTARSNHGGTTKRVNLGEFKVIAVPGEHPFDAPRFNIADPQLGGYVVWSDPLIPKPPDDIISEKLENGRIRLDANSPFTWVLGFHNDRAAQISELQWVQSPDIGYNAMSKVQVSTSADSPLGPWTALGTWALATAGGSTSTMTLPEPVWARYVRFTTNEPTEISRWHLPATLRVWERPTDDTYRSILTEWGHYAKPAIYERLVPPGVAAALTESDNNDSRNAAQPVTPGLPYSGSVLVGEDQDWYRLDIPAGDNRLSLEIFDEPVLRARFALYDDNEQPVLLQRTDRTGERPLFEATVDPGRRYTLHIDEPQRSIAFVWDNSGSVTPYKDTIYQAMSQFSNGIQPGREAANLLPFSKTGAFLRDDWAEQPYRLQETLNNYNRADTSSNAEFNLNAAIDQMRIREGTKAIIVLTDAATFSYADTPSLWRNFAQVRPRVFTLELHTGDVRPHQDLMQSWASAGDGVYDYFASNADLDVGFERAACHIRRPARYTLIATTREEAPPEPGFLVVSAPQVVAQGAIELILDASGSMLQRLDGTPRIAIARDVLTDLVTHTLPAGTPLALRIFGHRKPDACQTDLEVPLAPLDQKAVAKVIAGANAKNLAKTPIGRSLEWVATDLEGVEGPKLVILITDGEETCDGDPAAAIEALREAGFDVRLNIIGFAIDDDVLKTAFERWASAGGGRYFDAQGAAALSAAIKLSLRPKFQVLDASGGVMAEASVDSDALELPVGTYAVKVLTSPPQTFENVEIVSTQKKRLLVGSEP